MTWEVDKALSKGVVEVVSEGGVEDDVGSTWEALEIV
jgi:hypothetical protein